MTDKNLTELVCIIDRSGSMEAIKQDAEGGFNAFIEESKKLPGKVRVTLAQFDDKYDLVWNNVDIHETKKYVLEPRGLTALYDAVGKTVSMVGSRLARTEEEKRPSKVVVMIVTDGQENNSREFLGGRIAEVIKHQTDKYAWQFAYLGTNQDAFAEATKIGIRAYSTLHYDSSGPGIRSAYNDASIAMCNYVTGNTSNVDFSAPESTITTTADTSTTNTPTP